jgi:hypothetical protein
MTDLSDRFFADRHLAKRHLADKHVTFSYFVQKPVTTIFGLQLSFNTFNTSRPNGFRAKVVDPLFDIESETIVTTQQKKLFKK